LGGIKLDSDRRLSKLPRVIFSLRNLGHTLLLSAVFALAARGAETPPPPIAELSTADAVGLGLVEGVTEFLPISSTGHLIIATKLMGLESETQLKGKDGRLLWHKPPSAKYPDGVPLTLKVAADTYTVIIQVGAIAAVLLLYWRQVAAMIGGVFDRSGAGFRLLRNVVLATVPVVLVGWPASKLIDKYLFSIGAVIFAQVAGAGLMLWAEKWRRARQAAVGEASLQPQDLPPRSAVGIGLAQCVAIWPGTSRSMVTIVGGYLAGLNPARAAEFSFLVGLPTLAGAALLKAVQSGPAMIAVFGWTHILLGILVAAISAAIAVRFLVHFLTRHGLALFAYYRLVVAVVLLLIFVF
jgi:undecaprenyl-diphosphatase